MPLNPGALRHLIELKAPALVPDGAGGFSDSDPTTFATVWAEIKPLKANERIQAMQTTADISHQITIRYLEGVTADMTVVHEGRTFQIIAEPLDFEERHEMLTLLCFEVK